MTTNAQPFSEFLLALLGPMIWAGHFFVVYGTEAIICAKASSPTNTMLWIVTVTTVLATAGLTVLLVQRFRVKRTRGGDALHFLDHISIYLVMISMAAIVAVAASALHLPVCLPIGG